MPSRFNYLFLTCNQLESVNLHGLINTIWTVMWNNSWYENWAASPATNQWKQLWTTSFLALLNMLKHLIRILMTMLCDFIISAQMCNVMHSGALISFPINHLCTLWGVFMIGSQTFQLSHEFDLIAICVVFFFFFFFEVCSILYWNVTMESNCWCNKCMHACVDECTLTCLCENSVNHVMPCYCMCCT